MSEGPIKREREAWMAPKPIARGEAVCAKTVRKGHGFCGLTKPKDQISEDWNEVSCPECQAARRADEAVR